MPMDESFGEVKIVRSNEIERWCACPLRPGEDGYDDWLQGEKAWVAQWHEEPGNLFAYDAAGEWVGKYDVPFPRLTRWTLWAPTVRADEAAETVMAALCAHILVEAGLRFIPTIEVLLESHHGMFSLAKKKLVEAGFKVEGEKVLVAKDLTKEIPPVPTGIRIEPAADVSPVDLRALGRDVGMAPDDIEAWKPDSPQASLGVVAIRAGKPVGLCLAGSKPGEALLYEQHLGVHPSIRGQGLATAMFLAWLHRGKEAGATEFVGSTEKENASMLRVFEKVGCRPTGTRLVFLGRPKRA